MRSPRWTSCTAGHPKHKATLHATHGQAASGAYQPSTSDGFTYHGLLARWERRFDVAALDTRVAGVPSFAGFTPYKTDTADKPTGGLRRLSELHALLPRLGAFIGKEAQVPYDYDELLAAIAPRPTLLYTPTEDRDATHEEVAACVGQAKKAWAAKGAVAKLTVTAPDQITQMGSTETAAAVVWAKTVAGLL